MIDVIPMNLQNIASLVFHFFVKFIEKKPPIKLYVVFVHFSLTFEIAKFWMIKLYLDVSDVIHTNEHTKYANCDFYKNFWIFLLMPFCFMMSKNGLRRPLSKTPRNTLFLEEGAMHSSSTRLARKPTPGNFYCYKIIINAKNELVKVYWNFL